MTVLPGELRDLIESVPLAHLSTIKRRRSPQVTVIWVGLDGNDLVSGHMARHAKLRNIKRDPRVVLSFDAPREPGVVLDPYAVLRARATVQPSDGTWDLLNRLAEVYMSPDTEFPAPRGPGYIVRYSVERIGGVGPWVPSRPARPSPGAQISARRRDWHHALLGHRCLAPQPVPGSQTGGAVSSRG